MLEVRNLVVRYGAVTAIDGVSMAFEPGVVTSVIGSNGAGKTTLLNAISGMVRPASGSVWFEGERLDRRTPQQIVASGITQVPEGRELFPRMSVMDNLLCGAVLRSDTVAIRKDLDKVFGYFPILERRPNQLARDLSGGEQQMLALGRALMARPRMFLLDEPSTGLAPLVEKEVMDTVRRLAKEEDVGVVLVEQNAALALAASKNAYVLELGSISVVGPASELSNDDRVRAAYLVD